MSAEQDRRTFGIFREALERDVAERAAFLADRCADDAALRRRVEALLARDAAAGDDDCAAPAAMREALEELVDLATASSAPVPTLPTRLPGYRIVRLVAHGGMGDVYEGEQESPRRRVAIKIARGSEGSAELARRFAREIDLLARLRHPRIAQIIEAGTVTTPGGPEPFFAMEFVEGKTLKRHAADRLASTREKLDLMCTLCDAVAFAHEQGVVHRDLKPDNVLIEADGQPKVLDFGIAKVEAAGGFGGGTLRTEAGRVLGTLGYMAPEQLAGTVDVRPTADVYALGVLLFEVLAGRLPHDLDGVTLTQALAVVSTTDAPLLGVLAPQFRGDLEAIVAKALEKEARHRYADARELQRDLERFQRGETVVARVAGPLRRAVKWSQRNRALATAVVGLFAVLVVSSVLLLAANQEARTALGDYARLKDARRLDEAIARADVVRGDLDAPGPAVWPTRPEQLEGLRQWLVEFRPLLARLDEDRAALLRIEAGGGTRHGDRVTFADPAVQWQYDELARLVADLEKFGATAKVATQVTSPASDAERRSQALTGLVARVEQRLELARSIVRRSIVERQSDWDAAIARIADITANPRYGGLVLRPQVGLIPLGPDPESGLEEFLSLETHAEGRDIPTAAGSGARATLGHAASPDPGTGIVFVLIPGLRPGQVFWMGAQKKDPTAPNYDPMCLEHAETVSSVPSEDCPKLDAFFLAKYEMSNDQWGRITGEYPTWRRNWPRLPVGGIDWVHSDALVRRLGFTLPTEAQWEFAARAGRDTPWWTGKDEQSLQGYENVLELVALDTLPAGVEQSGEHVADFWDEVKARLRSRKVFRGPTPVGSYLPNPFGLHDMAGNVTEWCTPARPDSPARVARGGTFMRGPSRARTAHRFVGDPSFHVEDLGLRPARPIE